MNQNGSSRHHLAESDDATRAIAASRQWHDVELALKVARHSFERWLVADQLARNLAMVLMTRPKPPVNNNELNALPQVGVNLTEASCFLAVRETAFPYG